MKLLLLVAMIFTTPVLAQEPEATNVVRRGLTFFEQCDRDQFVKELSSFSKSELALIEGSVARREFLRGLCVLFDGQGFLQEHFLTDWFFSDIKLTNLEVARRNRLANWAKFNGRSDAVAHFFVSMGITLIAGPVLAEQAGVDKEIQDAKRYGKSGSGEGFSFVDIAYNHCGVFYTMAVTSGKIVSLSDFVPDFSMLKLPSKLTWEQFEKKYYLLPSYMEVVRSIDKTIRPNHKTK